MYPTKALIEDQKDRLTKKFNFKELDRTVEISVDTGESTDNTFYRADIILTTIDKLLYRVFGYGSSRWNYIYPWRLLNGDKALMKDAVLIFDEAHIYSEIPMSHLIFLINRLTYENNIQTSILSATLPEYLKKYLKDSDQKNYPRINGNSFFEVVSEKNEEINRGQQKYIDHLNDIEEVINKAIEEYKKGKKVGIIANWVYSTEERISVQEIWKKIKDELNQSEEKNLILYHGYQFPTQRENNLEQLVNSKKKYILIGTSALEVGVDISTEVMFTEICTPDAFVQRIGRCARESGVGKVYTFGNPNYMIDEKVGDKHKQLKENIFNYKTEILTNEIKEKINTLNTLDIIVEDLKSKLPYQIDEKLYKYIYDYNIACQDIWQDGMLITRDWMPSIYIECAGERLRIPMRYTLKEKHIQDWWLEVRGEYGEEKKIRANELDSFGSEDLNIYWKKGEKLIDAREVDLILKTELKDEEFGLIYRKSINSDRIQKNRKYNLVQLIYEPIKGVKLFWWEPEGVIENE
ncbi:CRISPR-associated helicase Cas3 [Sporohalobacter salinus]|nr:CRISPR-associated helicase Cas3 [Sporohalobacter salinus]